MAVLLFAETDAADTDLVHGRAVELQAHSVELGGIERLGGTGRLKRGEGRANRLEDDFPILVENLLIQLRAS